MSNTSREEALKNGLEDRTTNPYLILKQVPDSFIALRTELAKPENIDIFNASIRESSFEGSIATIAEKLDIVVDGLYDIGPLCNVLAAAMRQRHLSPELRHAGIPGLVEGVEIVETADSISLERTPEPAPPLKLIIDGES